VTSYKTVGIDNRTHVATVPTRPVEINSTAGVCRGELSSDLGIFTAVDGTVESALHGRNVVDDANGTGKIRDIGRVALEDFAVDGDT